MKSQEELAYKATSDKIAKLFKGTPTKVPKRVVIKDKADLSFLKNLSGFPKNIQSIYTPQVLPEPVFESAETLAGKLNSLIGALGVHVIKDLPSIDVDNLVPLVIEAIKNLKGNDRLDISHIRNGEQLAQAANKQKVDMNDMRWHGSGGASSSVTTVSNEVVSGSGNTFTLVHIPTTGSQKIFAIGQRLTPTVDYTIAGAVITTISTWNNGDILADYTY